MAGDDEYACADDGADAKRDQVPRPERAMKLMGFFPFDFPFDGHEILLRAATLTVAWGCAFLQHKWMDANQFGDIP
jgi:hypothetical protein